MSRLALMSGTPMSVCLIGFLLLGLACVPRSVLAQQATPKSTSAPGSCTSAPRTVAEITALLRPLTGDGEEVLKPRPLPVGPAADQTTITAIASTVEEIEACVNAGDLLRFYSLFSDDWFRQLPKREDILDSLIRLETATPVPSAEGKGSVFVGPWHVQILEDGRVLGAVVWFASEGELCPDPSRTKALTFVHLDGRWMVDAVIDHNEAFQEISTVVGSPPDSLLASRDMSCR